ncbi:DNA gyrase subunit A [Sphingomicrobium aestuariivivum]|uniref:DNA gyrase subunit A n=1 Tax=Sphingomicrobium aestuariivivum TaxID=1582356 RepID=UPI0021AE2997|nr:DNA gyrase subunit A [Sphingomicrobium aestuariivivum]
MADTPVDTLEPRRDIEPISIVDEMKSSYLDYAMSVIVSRALPDVRDGLKPVHRRILYACQEAGYVAGRPYRKSSRIVGDVMGKYHPHGDSAIYDALARMTQDWSLRVPLIDGQGNFGSMDPDPPAAMRYTEARLAKVANFLLGDIEKDTVAFQDNYDGSESEPTVLPARFPNLLVNGAGGIAVGMATNIPPHNLGEVIQACKAYIEDPAISVEGLMEYVKGPDFPTGAQLLGASGIRSAYTTGRGSMVLRSKYEIEEGRGDKRQIVLTEIPFQVGKAGLVEKIAEAAKDKRIEGVADIRDESNREGVRIVIECKRDATPDVVLNQLWRHTPAQSSFAANMLAIRGGKPETLDLRDMIEAFVKFREEVITNRSKFELNKARERAHLLLGLVVAVTNLDEVVAMIRGSGTPAEAREKLITKEWPIGEILPYIELVEGQKSDHIGDVYRLSEAQVKAILELRLHRLTQLGRDEIGSELEELRATIEELLEILSNRARLYEVMREEFDEVEEQYATPRKTELAPAADGIEDEDLIEVEDMVVTVTHTGYIKRTALALFREQKRGGKGRSGMSTKDEDIVTNLFVTTTHNPVLFFSNLGKVYRMKVWKLPEGGPTAKGRPMINLLPLADGEKITTVLPLPRDEEEWADLHIMFATEGGTVRRNAMDAFTNVPSNGKIAMKFDEGEDGKPVDRLIGVDLLTEDDDVLLATQNGKAIRFEATKVREFASRASTGVRGIRLLDDDKVISMSILTSTGSTREERDAYLKSPIWRDNDSAEGLSPERYARLAEKEQFLLTITENGYGKRTSTFEYRVTGRGGQGVANIVTSERNGGVVASFPVEPGEQLMLVTDQGKMIRTTVADIRIAGRNTQGVTIFKVAKNEKVVSVARIDEEEEPENEAEEAAAADLQGDDKTVSPTTGAMTDSDDAAGPADGE